MKAMQVQPRRPGAAGTEIADRRAATGAPMNRAPEAAGPARRFDCPDRFPRPNLPYAPGPLGIGYHIECHHASSDLLEACDRILQIGDPMHPAAVNDFMQVRGVYGLNIPVVFMRQSAIKVRETNKFELAEKFRESIENIRRGI